MSFSRIFAVREFIILSLFGTGVSGIGLFGIWPFGTYTKKNSQKQERYTLSKVFKLLLRTAMRTSNFNIQLNFACKLWMHTPSLHEKVENVWSFIYLCSKISILTFNIANFSLSNNNGTLLGDTILRIVRKRKINSYKKNPDFAVPLPSI